MTTDSSPKRKRGRPRKRPVISSEQVEKHLAKEEGRKSAYTGKGGKFKKGNPGGKGNPYARYATRLKGEFYKHCDKHPRTIARIFNRLLFDASVGEYKAQKLFFDMGMGKARPAPDLEPSELEVDGAVKGAQAELMRLITEPAKPVTELTDEVIDLAKQLVIAGLPQDAVADALGVRHEVWEAWIDAGVDAEEDTLERRLVMRMRQGMSVHRSYLTIQAVKSVSGSMRMLERRDPGTFGESPDGDTDLHVPDERFA